MRPRILTHLIQLDTGTDIRIAATVNRPLGTPHMRLTPGDRVRIAGGVYVLAKRFGLGTYLGLWWSRGPVRAQRGPFPGLPGGSGP